MADSTRRDFLRNAGAYGAAAGVGLAGGLGLGNPAGIRAQPQHPFGYPDAGLDVERTRELGYAGFKGITLADGTGHAGCAFGAFNAILGQLAEVVGELNSAMANLDATKRTLSEARRKMQAMCPHGGRYHDKGTRFDRCSSCGEQFNLEAGE